MDIQGTDIQSRRDARYNYFAASVDTTGFPIGNTFMALVTVIPAFLSELTDSKWVIGGVQSLYSLGVCLPPLIAANYIQRMPRKTPFVFRIAVLERMAILALAIAAFYLGKTNPGALLLITFLMLGINFFGMGINYASYSTMIAKIIPTRRRGRLYGWSGTIAGILSIGAAWVLDLLLKRYGFPNGYAYSFFLAFIILMVSIIPIAFIREPEEHNGGTHQGWRCYWRSLLGVLQKDRNFTVFTISQALMAFSAMATAFLTLYAKQQFHIGSGTIAFYTGVSVGSSVVASAFWGIIIDRRGNKLTLGAGTLIGILASVAAIALPDATTYSVVFILTTFASYAFGIASFNIVLEFCEPVDSPRYIALATAIPAPFRGIAPMLGAFVVQRFGYAAAFGLTGVMLLAGLLVLLRVHEPRHLANIPIPVER